MSRKKKTQGIFSVHYAARHSGETNTREKVPFNPECGLEFSISIELGKKNERKDRGQLVGRGFLTAEGFAIAMFKERTSQIHWDIRLCSEDQTLHNYHSTGQGREKQKANEGAGMLVDIEMKKTKY